MLVNPRSQNQSGNFVIFGGCSGILEPLIFVTFLYTHSRQSVWEPSHVGCFLPLRIPKVLNSVCQLQWPIIQVLQVNIVPKAEVLKIPGEHRSLKESLINGKKREDSDRPLLRVCVCARAWYQISLNNVKQNLWMQYWVGWGLDILFTFCKAIAGLTFDVHRCSYCAYLLKIYVTFTLNVNYSIIYNMFLDLLCLLLNPCSTKRLKVPLDLPFTLTSDGAGRDAPIIQDLKNHLESGANTSFLVAKRTSVAIAIYFPSGKLVWAILEIWILVLGGMPEYKPACSMRRAVRSQKTLPLLMAYPRIQVKKAIVDSGVPVKPADSHHSDFEKR